MHHLNCGTFCPAGSGRLGRVTGLRELVCHCLLIETSEGLVLVDSGFGSRDVDRPMRIGPALRFLGRPSLSHSETALFQVRSLGFRSADVRHIVLTHLDPDHAGALQDFPNASVHIRRAEFEAAHSPTTRMERSRYRPQNWAHGPKWSLVDDRGEDWQGFAGVTALEGLPPEILMVPLPGHSRGHVGLAVQGENGWLLHAGDAFFSRRELEGGTTGVVLTRQQRALAVDLGAWERTRDALCRLHARADDGAVFCAHDGEQLERLRAASHMA